MFGGSAPDAWFGPWLSDAIFGILVPAIVYLFWKQRSIVIWGIIIIYNALGAFDYATGLMTQWLHPLPHEIAPPFLVYSGISVFMSLQLIALALLFRTDVITHFTTSKSDREIT